MKIFKLRGWRVCWVPTSAVLMGSPLVLILKCAGHYHCHLPNIKMKLSSKKVEKAMKKSGKTKRPRKTHTVVESHKA